MLHPPRPCQAANRHRITARRYHSREQDSTTFGIELDISLGTAQHQDLDQKTDESSGHCIELIAGKSYPPSK